MNSILRLISDSIGEYRSDQHAYHREDRQEIAARNLRFLYAASLFTVLIMATLLIVATILFPGWHISFWHVSFLPVSVLLHLLIARLAYRRVDPQRVAQPLCILFELDLFFFLSMIDTYGSPTSAASFMPLVLIVMPVLFTLPHGLSYRLNVLGAAFFLTMVALAKTSKLFLQDVFITLTALLLSMALDLLVSSLRIHDYQLRREAQYLSTHDTLSDTYNKRAFELMVRGYLQSRGGMAVCAFAILDLDDFKQINDSYGHLYGDLVLRTLGETLCALTAPSDLVSRFGGDEFVIFTTHAVDPASVRHRFDWLRAELNYTLSSLEGHPLTFSLGLVWSDGRQPLEYDLLLAQADAALYRSKRQGKNNCLAVPYDTAFTAADSPRPA